MQTQLAPLDRHFSVTTKVTVLSVAVASIAAHYYSNGAVR